MDTKNYNEVLNTLGTIPVFEGLNQDDLKHIVPHLEMVHFPTGTKVISEGAYGESMYIILRGTVKVTKGGDDEVTISTLYSGSYFGEFSLIDNMPRSASVTTIEDTEMLILKKEAFDRVLARKQKIATIFYRNCLRETFSRQRSAITNLTFSQHILHEKTNILDEISKDLTLAKKVQRYFLNMENLDNEEKDSDIRHSYIYHPCSEVGGDFINIAKLDGDHVAIIIADVMGHGITAALATGVLKSAFTISVPELGLKPAELMSFLHKHILKVVSELYATCYYALIDRKKKLITFTKAGHHHPLFWKVRQGDYIAINCIGNGLGLWKETKYAETILPYEPGDKLLFFTDGIIEQTNSTREMYTEARLRALFRELSMKGSPGILENVFNDLKKFTGDAAYDDDITMLLLEF